MSGSEDFIIGVPAGHIGYTVFYNNFLRWISGQPVRPMIAESNRVDVNRSQIIEVAKREKKHIIFLDSDALPQLSLVDMIKLIEEDFKKCDIVVAPVRGVNGQILIKPLKGGFQFPQKASEFVPFEVEAGSFTFAAVSYKLIEKLKPLSQYGLVDNTFVPLYVAYTTQTSEEYAFCKKARKDYGAKIYCDPRMRVSHFKAIPLEPPMPIEEIQERQKAYQKMLEEKGKSIPEEVEEI